MQNAEINNWVIESLLGEGGMGEVWLARHRKLGTAAAVKFLSSALTREPKFRERFYQEARTQAQLHHPHIAQVMDFDDRDGKFLIVIEYLSGGSLADIIDRARGPVETSRAIGWVRQSLAALDFAHQRGIIHRDIKPSNIMIDEHGQAKVTDFGIALVMGERRMTSTGVAIGTPHYMSPEQIVRPKDVDHRTDVYSMGVVLYELLTGRMPFDGDSDFVVKTAQVNDQPPSLRRFNPRISEGLERIVLKALAKDPNKRYVSCGEFARAIEVLQSHRPVAETPAAEKPGRKGPDATASKPNAPRSGIESGKSNEAKLSNQSKVDQPKEKSPVRLTAGTKVALFIACILLLLLALDLLYSTSR